MPRFLLSRSSSPRALKTTKVSTRGIQFLLWKVRTWYSVCSQGTRARTSLETVCGTCENRLMLLAPLFLAGTGCAAGTYSWAACVPSAQLFGRTIRKTGDPRTLALTFDDGPNPAVTPDLLDLLDRHAIRATFFLIGAHVRAFPEL